MKKKQPKWKPIKMGDRLPCQSFLRKKNGEILKLSTVGGVTVGQDAYYLPVDDVIEEIRNYPIEESEDEKMRKELFERFSHIKGFDWYGLPIKDILAWLEKQGEQNPAWSEEDEKILNKLLAVVDLYYGYNGNVLDKQSCTSFLKSLRPQNTWKPSEHQMSMLRAIVNDPNNVGAESCHLAMMSLYDDLSKLK